jgi:hypothetical protein
MFMHSNYYFKLLFLISFIKLISILIMKGLALRIFLILGVIITGTMVYFSKRFIN